MVVTFSLKKESQKDANQYDFDGKLSFQSDLLPLRIIFGKVFSNISCKGNFFNLELSKIDHIIRKNMQHWPESYFMFEEIGFHFISDIHEEN